MIEKLNELQEQIKAVLSAAKDPAEVENLRVKMLGRKGEMTLLLKAVGSLPPEERRETGQKANEIRDFAQESIEAARIRLEAESQAEALKAEAMDITLPGRRKALGRLHPITEQYMMFEEMFLSLGFDIVEGPHIETVYHNFDALNTPHNHPSRDEQDTFYFNENFVLRTHTSPTQVRTMESRKPPIRVIAPGKVFRRDEIDATHTPVFHQLEGLVIDKGVTFGDLKGMLEIICKFAFGDASIRLRPSYFPFTEPSAEVDISCYACRAASADCRVCKGSGWVELWGCGMVHPEVLRMSGIDPDIYSGYAFGLGVDRISLARKGIPEIRLYFENDMQFLDSEGRK